ncbi:MAG TPA: hypothetical protein VM843_07110 [Flavisolibacter sp.]|jgi:hypothetical protein|nr:hypothetical protein [Flavisolibacter sp.]
MKKYLLIAAATLFTTATVTASVLASKENKAAVKTEKKCTRANVNSDVVKAEKRDCAKMERTHCFD